MAACTPKFTKIVSGLIGAEGPVFNKDLQFFMVAPCRENEQKEADGDVVKVNLEKGTVSHRVI